MGLEDKSEEKRSGNEDDKEDRTIRNLDGEVTHEFKSLAEKSQFIKGEKEVNTFYGEGFRCGHCAAYPCFRNYEKNSPAPMICFQNTKQCREECDFYSRIDQPQGDGICRKDRSRVGYGQVCHIPEIKSSSWGV